MGVDFAANASSKAIKESVDLSAAPDEESPTYTTSINSDNQYVYTFNYNGTYALNKVNISGPSIGYYTRGNTLGMDGTVQTITLPAGTYKLEVWGASGGESHWGSKGGKGGYSRGTITLTTQTTLYVAVGGKGPDVYRLETSGGTPAGGGWNGGGNTLGSGAGAGGGATHIATAKVGDGQLKNYSSTANRANVLIVAGGGGGSENDGPALSTPITTSNYKGSAGGTQGGVGGYAGAYQTSCHGLGATQTTPGGHCVGTNTSSHSHTSSSWNVACTNGSFGQGGSGVGQSWGGGGGGGGWYGGGGALINGGGGGSGYVKSTLTSTFMNTCGTNGTGDTYSNVGNGKAVITDLTKCATQSSTPTVTINRHESKTFAFAGTSSDNSLLGVDPNSLALSVHTNAVYQVNGLADNTTQETLRARTWAATEKADAAASKWLSYSFTTDGISLRATRYWTGTKAFYVRVKNSHGTPSWFKFYASVEGGELKKDKT